MRIPVLVILSSVLFFFSAKSQTWQPVGPDDFNEPAFDVSTSTAMAIDVGGHPYVAYRDGYTNIEHVSKFNGSTWIEVGNLGIILPSNSSEVSLFIDAAGAPYIAYTDVTSSKPTVKKFDGSSWIDVGSSAAMNGLVSTGIGCALGVTAGGTVYTAFPDISNSNKLALRILFPGGDWLDMAPGGATSSSVFAVSMALYGSDHYIAFSDGSKGGAISVIKFDPGPSLVGSSGFSSGGVNFTSIAVDASGTPYVAFADGGNFKKIAVKKYDGANWIDVGTPGFSTGEAQNITLKIDGSGNVYVLYCDLGNSNKTMVKKFDGSSWIDAGPDISTVGGSRQKMALDAAGTPYVIFVAAGTLFEQKAEVKKLTGGTWTTVGTKGIEEDGVRATKMVTNSSGTPYVVYQNWTTKKPTVRKYDGNSWVPVGPPGFSVSGAGFTTIAMSPNNIPYVFYADQFNGGATVKKFDGSNWVDVGAPGFFTNGMDNTSIAFDAGGTPYVTYKNLVSGKINVQKYDGSNWVSVGAADFSAGTVNHISLALDASGTPFVTYADASNTSLIIVKKFDGSNWVDVGTPGISAGFTGYNCLAFDGNGILYVGYYDGEGRVRKFDGTNWIDMGPVGSGPTNVMTLAIDKNNIPFVAYNILPGPGMGVKKFDGSNWVAVGNTAICAGKSSVANGYYLAFGAGNVPLLSYTNGSMYVKSFGPLAVLPLRLTAFNGRIEKANGLLNWKTDNEINTQTFIVERSTDGRKYLTAGAVQANNESGVHQYAFIDKNVDQLGASVIYYRLNQVEIDGKSTYSRVLMLQIEKSANRLICYPNPVASETNLSITLDKAASVQARIIDNMGNAIQAKQWSLGVGTTAVSMDMSQLPKGLYYIEIKSQSIKKQIPLIKL